jgi:hypothetical protein
MRRQAASAQDCSTVTGDCLNGVESVFGGMESRAGIAPAFALRAANGTDADEAERQKAIDEILDEVLREKPSKISLSKIVLESR